jgi:hypothetical protein
VQETDGGKLAIFDGRFDLVFGWIIENHRRFWGHRPTNTTSTEAMIYGFTADLPSFFGSMMNNPELGDIVMAHRLYPDFATARSHQD